MSDIGIAVAIAVAVGLASFLYNRRSPTYIVLSILLFATTVMFMMAMNNPERRWIGMLFTLFGAAGSFRAYTKLKAEQTSPL